MECVRSKRLEECASEGVRVPGWAHHASDAAFVDEFRRRGPRRLACVSCEQAISEGFVTSCPCYNGSRFDPSAT